MLAYFSGPHGAGKSTLTRKVAESYPDKVFLYPEDRLDCIPKVADDCYERLKVKLFKYYFERVDQQRLHQQTMDMPKNNSMGIMNNIMLCNRCEYDSLMYARAFRALGWVTAQQYQRIDDLFYRVLEDEPLPVIIVNPSMEILQTQLHKRWMVGEKKWREENRDYLAAVHEEFEKFGKENKEKIIQQSLLYLTDEPLEEKVKKVALFLNLTLTPPRTQEKIYQRGELYASENP